MKLRTMAGDSFTTVSNDAKKISIDKNVTVEFEFNDVTCFLDKDTDLELLFRDYCNSWTMGWKEVGPNCVKQYSAEVQAEIEKRTKEKEEKRKIEEAEYRAKEEKERQAFLDKTKGIEIELSSKDDWELGKSKNTDSYVACIYEYAEGWAKLMQAEISQGKKLEDIADVTSHEMGFMGITGFMYGAAVSILSQCWVHGESLRKWHNKEYNHDGDGVVNRAILTIGV